MKNNINKPICVLQAPVFSRSGYGDHSRDILRSLYNRDEYDIKVVATTWGSCPNTELQDDSEFAKFVRNSILKGPLQKKPEIHIQISIPNEFTPQGKYNIGITAGIETTLCRAEWIEGVNKMDLIIVPSQHAKTVFENSKFKKKLDDGQDVPVKLEKPIEVLFEGSDLEVFGRGKPKHPSVDEQLKAVKEDFCFLFVGHWLQGDIGADRKDIGMLVKTFLQVFKGKKEAPALVLKTSGAGFSVVDQMECLRKIKMIRESVGGDDLPNVYLLHGELTMHELNYLYNHTKVKAHVSFTHGEGYGRPLQEASLSGKPVIASGWSGHVDFLNKDYAELLTGELVKIPDSAANEWIIKESKWFAVNYSIAAQRLEDVFKNYKKYETKGQKLARENEKKFSLTKMYENFDKILDNNLPKFTITADIQLPKLNLPKLKKK